MVRRFAPDEWRTYRDLRLRALAESPDAFGSTHEREVCRSDQEWEARLREGAGDDAQLPLVALSDAVPVGLAWGRQDRDDAGVAHLFQVWVAPEARARGIGRLLLDAVIEWAKARGVRAIRLGVTPSHPAALHLYRRVGFLEAGAPEPLRPGSPIPCHPMELPLEPSFPPGLPDERGS